MDCTYPIRSDELTGRGYLLDTSRSGVHHCTNPFVLSHLENCTRTKDLVLSTSEVL